MGERKPPPLEDKRRPLHKRFHTDMIYRNGRVEIAKIAEIAGYVLVACIVWRHNEALLNSPGSMALLLSVMVAPSVAKKALTKFVSK